MELVAISSINPIEQHNEELVCILMQKIKNDGLFIEPIIIDKTSYVILNGHHRLEACKRLGLTKIPCKIVDYNGKVTLTTGAGSVEIPWDFLCSMHKSGLLFPFKTVNFPNLYPQEGVSLSKLR